MGKLDIRLLQELTRNIETALREDEVERDVTTLACLPKNEEGVATVTVKEAAILAGLPFLPLIAYAVDSSAEVTLLAEEGATIEGGEVAEIKGPMGSLLSMERTLINFLQHTTSIATETARYVKEADGKCDILDTRKTLPCHRFLQKYAVKIGGGKNHRFHLADHILIKDNHLIILQIGEAILKARESHPSKKVQVEVESLEMFDEAVKLRSDAIMLDNMSLEEMREAVKRNSEGIYLEASGGIELENIRSIADTGIDGISVGKLTHTIKAVDVSIEIRRNT